MECIEFLLKNPLFSGKVDYQPRQDFNPAGERVYSEWITGDGAWDLQVRTLLPSYYDVVLIWGILDPTSTLRNSPWCYLIL